MIHGCQGPKQKVQFQIQASNRMHFSHIFSNVEIVYDGRPAGWRGHTWALTELQAFKNNSLVVFKLRKTDSEFEMNALIGF